MGRREKEKHPKLLPPLLALKKMKTHRNAIYIHIQAASLILTGMSLNYKVIFKVTIQIIHKAHTRGFEDKSKHKAFIELQMVNNKPNGKHRGRCV